MQVYLTLILLAVLLSNASDACHSAAYSYTNPCLFNSVMFLSPSANMGLLCHYRSDPPGDFNLCTVLLHKVLLQREEEKKEAESEAQPERAEWCQYSIAGE